MAMHRRAATRLLSGFGWVVAAGPALAEAKTVEVSMGKAQMRFLPDTVRIGVGDTVQWTNPAVITHSVTFDPGLSAKPGNVMLPDGVAPFDSGEMEQDAQFSHTFTVKGTYKYICKLHEAMGMVGTVIVT
jgi:plastocyanin